MGRTGITNYFVNTIITALQAPEWDTLLQRSFYLIYHSFHPSDVRNISLPSIGADAMLHLLTEAQVFVSLPNDCLCQMTGEPVIHMVPATLQGSEQPSTVPLTMGGAKPGKRPFPFSSTHNDRQRKRLKISAFAPTLQKTTRMTVSK